jgi:protein-S-isoprenylcysteine O-methyltransferase Ste14
MLRALAILATFPAGATPYFYCFWRWFDFWRRHVFLTFALMLGMIGGLIVALVVLRERVFGPALAMPWPVRSVGWALIATTFVLAVIADRQLGIRVRSFMPFFEPDGRIELRTTGAYGVVRHPIYAAGIGYQIGAFLVTGYLAITIAAAILALGALWFTRQEEHHLVALLEDPTDYDRYRARVPALLPRLRRRSRPGTR